MAEEDVQYASVTFKNKNQSQERPKREEDTVYDNVRVNHKTTQETPDAKGGLLSEKEEEKCCQNYKLLAVCFGVICLVLLLSIVGFVLYVALIHKSDENNQLKANQSARQKENENLTNFKIKLSADVVNVTGMFDNLKKNFTVLELKVTSLTAENQNLTSQNEKLKTSEKILTERVQMLEKNLTEFNVVLLQRVMDNYCPKENNDRKCKPCQKDWNQKESSCYVYNNAKGAEQRSWAGAQDDCKEKLSSLTVISDENEKTHVFTISAPEGGISGFWIGLRAVNRTWKWIDGTDLINQTWVDQPAADGQCVTSLRGSGWRSVSCEIKNAWICENKALSIP
ncbi:C-type lectin domain family 12 member B [Nothobranchius furzeri]